MDHSFATVPVANIPRSSFQRNSGLKTTFDADYLIPIFVDEVIPNDTFNMSASAVIRLNSPTLHPLMDNMQCDVHWFFVAYRLIWDNWAKMHGAQDDPGDSITFTTPIIASGLFSQGELADYMGLPLGLDPSVTSVSCLPFRAFRKIYNDWYRDENLQASLTLVTDNGPDTNAELGYSEVPPKRGKRYDYFTSALTSLQKGTAVTIDLGTSADVYTKVTDGVTGAQKAMHMRQASAGALAPAGMNVHIDDTTAGDMAGNSAASEAGTAGIYPANLYTDLSSALGPTLNDLRLAIATQRLLERDARSGTRYREHLLAHFGADNDDLRLARAEFLGAGTIPIHINAVPNTSEDAAQKQGELTGYGMGTGNSGFTKTFKEWGIIIGIASVSGDITYSQGIDKFWTKQTRYEYAYPILANIGEQSVLDQEIWHDAAGTNNTDVWGYQPRYEEYRFKLSRCTGLMNVDASGTLSSWHLSEDHSSRPSLDSTFIESNITVPLDRAIAIPAEPQFNADFYFKLTCARPLPLNGIPGLTRL